MKKLLALFALNAAVSTPLLAHDTWVGEVTYTSSTTLFSAVSPAGKFALVHETSDHTGAEVNIRTADLGPFSDFLIETGMNQSMSIRDVLFLNETTIVVAGSLGWRPYIGAFHAGTGTPIWEKTLTEPGTIYRIRLNSIGNIIGVGRGIGNGYHGIVCAVNTSGGWSWFRHYNPSNSANSAHDVVPLPSGDMVLLSSGSDGVSISRLTDWGHPIWSKWVHTPHLNLGTLTGCVSSDGEILVSTFYKESSDTKENCVFRMTTDGQIVWAKRYAIPSLLGESPSSYNIIASPGGGAVFGCSNLESGMFRTPAVLAINASGDVQWSRDLGVGQPGGVGQVLPHSGEGVIAVSYSGADTAMIYRLDALGYSGPCSDTDMTVNVTAANLTTTAFTYDYAPYPGGIGALVAGTSMVDASQSGMVCSSTDTIGSIFCNPVEANSTGQSTSLTASLDSFTGSGLHLEIRRGPIGQFGYVLVGTGVNPAGVVVGQGRLCLSTDNGNQLGRYNIAGTNMDSLGRFNSTGQLENLAGTAGNSTGFDVPLELPGIGGVISSGQTWHFQVWHRDLNTGSNLSNGISFSF